MNRNGIHLQWDTNSKSKELRNRLTSESRVFEGIYEAQHNTLSEISEYCKRRADIENDYYRSLKRLYGRFHEKRNDSSKSSRLAEKGYPSIRAVWESTLDRLKSDIQSHERLAQEYVQIVLPRLQQSDEFMQRIWKKSTDIEGQSHSELDEQMKKLERTLKYYIQSRHNEQHAKTKLSGINTQKSDTKIERRLSKVSLVSF